jgi:hypothetical protein
MKQRPINGQPTAQGSIAAKLAHNAEAIKRWERKATRAMNALAKLRKQRTRLERQGWAEVSAALAPPAKPAALPAPVMLREPTLSEATDATVSAMLQGASFEEATASKPTPADDKLDIPGFLRRGRSPEDQAAIDAAKAEKADRAKRKRQGQDAARKARRSGATRRMPLTGRAALDAIKGAQ